MGYDVTRFVGPVNDGLLCCICKEVLEKPVQAPCEHAYCSKCIHNWLALETTCPEDRRSITTSQLKPLFRYMNNDLAKLRIRCSFYDGCGVVTELENVDIHEATCATEVVLCTTVGCCVNTTRGQLGAHLVSCEYLTRQCQDGCGLLIVGDVDRDHNCVAELRTSLELLRSEMLCQVDECNQEMRLKVDKLRSQMTLNESLYNIQVSTLTDELNSTKENLKILMDLDIKRQQDIETLRSELVSLRTYTNGLSQTGCEIKHPQNRKVDDHFCYPKVTTL